jgi:hypothetical protein
MPEPDIVGTPRPSTGDAHDFDGVVLFDSTPPEPTPEREDDSGSRPPNGLVIALLLAAVALGGYQVFFSSPEDTDIESAEAPSLVATGLDPIQPALRALDGDFRSAQAGTDVMLEVHAGGSAGVPIVDSLVQFVMAAGDAALQADASRTDSSGVARATLRLAETTGRNVVIARLVGSTLEARVTVESVPAAPARLIASAGDGQEGEVIELLPERPSVLVTDVFGNPVPGAVVLFTVVTGGGSAAPGRMPTDSSGMASAMWRLGAEIGTQELQATLRPTGSSVTFRANALGRPTQIEGASRVLDRGPVSVAPQSFVVGGTDVCEITGGTARCRGADDHGQTGGRNATDLVALAAGFSHVCALDSSGEAICWGANDGGQLGDGSRTDRRSPVPVRTETRFSSLTAGVSHTCGIAQGSIAVCWGENLSGQLGDGTRTDARFPRAVGGGITFKSLVAGWNHTCGLSNNGNAFCWGPNSEGQLGDGSRLDRLTPALVRGAIDTLAAGSNHTCGISDGDVLCWGDNRAGQVGDGTNESRDQPEAVVGLPGRVTQISAGAAHTCALVVNGSAYCWGQNLRGQLGDGTNDNRNTAIPVAGGLRFRSIHAGGALTCGLTTEGAEYCWGFNQDGQLGDGTRQNRSSPVRVSG